ncbi:MAG: hypothetical protein AAF725_20040, partial [Acidobacteriota bacterium]
KSFILLGVGAALAGCGERGGSSNSQVDLDNKTGAWAVTELETEVKASSFDLERLDDALRRAPNLRDLHAPDGALSLASAGRGIAALKILDRAGIEVRVADWERLLEGGITGERGYFSFGGREYDSLEVKDRTLIEWPLAAHRIPVPSGSATLSMSAKGVVRVTNGDSMSVPVRDLLQVYQFSRSLRVERHPDEWDERVEVLEPPTPVEGLTIELGAGGALPAVEALEVRGAAPVLVQPTQDSTVSDLVAFLSAALERRPFRIALDLEGGSGRPTLLLGGEPQKPMLTLKLDAGLTWKEVRPLLQEIAPNFPAVLVRTRQDLSDLSGFDLDGYPGGLPGGVILPLRPARHEAQELILASTPEAEATPAEG